MASILQKPARTHEKSNTAVSVRTIGRDLEDGDNPAGRRNPEAFHTDIGNRMMGLEFISKPSGDPRDPLNWPTWKKELTFASIMLSTAVVGILKTLFVSTTSIIATQLNVSYVAAASLTGVPFIFAALSGIGASILAAVIGKRSLYVVGGVLMLIGALWNMQIEASFAQFMVSRLIQGIGWGMSEALILGSIGDLFLENERKLRVNIYTIISIIFTWGSPILGGYLSQSSDGFSKQVMIVNIIQAFSVFFLIFFVPETAFSRPSLSTSDSASSTNAESQHSTSPFRSYIKTLRPVSYHAPLSMNRAILPIRALAAPTAILELLLTFPLIATSHALANSLSLLFARMPTLLFPSRLGFLFTFPLIFSLVGVSLLSLLWYLLSRSPGRRTAKQTRTATFPAVVLGVTGLLAFGLYMSGHLTPKTPTVSAAVTTGTGLSLTAVSALFGMLVASSALLSSAGAHLFLASSSSSSQNSSDRENTGAHLHATYRFWLDVFTGSFIIAMPAWLQMRGAGSGSGTAGIGTDLRDTCVALVVVQVVLGSTAAAVVWVMGEQVKGFDRRILGGSGRDEERNLRAGRVERWESLEKKGSFFEP